MDGVISTSNVTSYPVWFDLDADGVKEQVGWTALGTRDAFLWIDLNRNDFVDGGQELFGNRSRLPDGMPRDNGFAALGVYDQGEFGGNEDGTIDAADRVWRRLMLWTDADQDGIADRGEVQRIARSIVEAVSLRYARTGFFDGNSNYHVAEGIYWTSQGLGGILRPYQVEDIAFQAQ